MLSQFRTSCLIASMLLAPGFTYAAAISVNGTCEMGNCSSPDPLNQGGATNGTFSYLYTFTDGDKYSVVGSYSASYNTSTSIGFSVVANYIGNASNSASSADLLPVDLLQDYNFTGDPNGTYSVTANLVQTGDAAGSYTEAHVSYDDQSLGLLGPYYGPGTQSLSSSATLSGLTDPLAADFNYTFYFAAGTPAVPEPAEAALLTLGLVALLVPVLRRRKRAAGAISYNQ